MDDPEVLEKLIQKAQHSTDDSPVTVTKNGGGRRTNITSTNMKSGEYTALMKRAGAQNGEAWHHSMSIHERRKRELIRRQAEQEEYERCKQQYNQKAALGVQKKAPTIYDTLWGDASAADDSLTKKIKVSVAVVPRDGSKQETAKEKDAEKAKKKHKHKKQKSEDKGTNSQPIAQTESTQSTLLESTRHLNPTANLREQQQQQKQQQQQQQQQRERTESIIDDLEGPYKDFLEQKAFHESTEQIFGRLKDNLSETSATLSTLSKHLSSKPKELSGSSEFGRILQASADAHEALSKSFEIIASFLEKSYIPQHNSSIQACAQAVEEARVRYLAARREHISMSKVNTSSSNLSNINFAPVAKQADDMKAAYQTQLKRFNGAIANKPMKLNLDLLGEESKALEYALKTAASLGLEAMMVRVVEDTEPSHPPTKRVETLTNVSGGTMKDVPTHVPSISTRPVTEKQPPLIKKETSSALVKGMDSSSSRSKTSAKNIALLKSAFVPQAADGEIDPSNEGEVNSCEILLDEDQLKLATYETYLLLSNYPFEHPEQWDDSRDLHQGMRLHFQISRKLFAKVTAWLKAPYVPFKAVVAPTLLYYRLHLAKTFERTAFERDEEYKLWRERQLRVFQAGFRLIVENGGSSWDIQGKKVSSQELLDDVDNLVHRALEAPVKSLEIIHQIDQAVVDAFQKSTYFAKSGSGSIPALPYPQGLLELLYGKMVDLMFDADTKSLQSQSTALLQEFVSLREVAGINDGQHCLCVLIALVDALKAGCSVDEVVQEVLELHSKGFTDELWKASASLAEKLKYALESLLLDMFKELLEMPHLFSLLLPVYVLLRKSSPRSQVTSTFNDESWIGYVIYSSARSHYLRLKNLDDSGNAVESFVKLAETLTDEFEFGLETFTSQIIELFPKASSCLALSFATLYFDDFAGSVKASELNPSSAKMLAGVQKFCRQIQAHEPEFQAAEMQSIFDEWFAKWAKEQERTALAYAVRIMQAELWKSNGSRGKAPAVIDFSTMLAQYLPLYEGLCVFSGQPLVSYARIVRSAVDAFLTSVQDCIIAKADLIPETIQLVHLFANKQSKPVVIKRQGYPMLSEQTSRALSINTLTSDCLRLLSCILVKEEMLKLLKDVSTAIEEAAEDDAKSLKDLETVVEDICKKIDVCQKSLLEYLGARVIFGDLRASFLHGVYKPDPNSNPIQGVISSLQDLVEDFAGIGLPPSVMQALMAAIEGEFFRCLDLVLIDIDPSRKFFPDQQPKGKGSVSTNQETCETLLDDDVGDAVMFFRGREDLRMQGKWSERNAMFSLEAQDLIETLEDFIKSKELDRAERVAHIIIMNDHKDVKAYLKKKNLST
eukprot:TRINITY_DN473_c0_g1_i11.p1 TRINITY_DN473_c0_g1~~TRINITY_DN473_c0_g1_i11.p1  ORF type:complete len:1349 (+),score=337.86 TRINITY_DN473_c0_g1_i11:47-4093(+)